MNQNDTKQFSIEELRKLRPRKGNPHYIGKYPYDGYEEVKPHIFARDGYVCQVCGKTLQHITEFLGVQVNTYDYWTFTVHHINGNPKDQSWENLQVVCQSCNRSTPQRRGWSKEVPP